MTEEQVPSEERVEERRVETDNIAQPLNMPNIGSKPNQPRHFNFPKDLLARKMLFIALSKLHGLIDGSGYTMIVPEMWRFVLLA